MTGYSVDQDRLYESLTEPPKEDFIRFYPNVLDVDILEHLLELIKRRTTWWMQYRHDAVRTDRRISLQDFDSELASVISESIITKGFHEYVKDFPYLQEEKLGWCNIHILLQETCPGEGYHAWHAENVRHEAQGRIVTWMIYLNDIEEGGETEFLYQQRRFKPTKNTLLMWPAGYTHLHRGNPPFKQKKYILTGWMTAVPKNARLL